MDQESTFLELSDDQIGRIVHGMIALFAGVVSGVTREPDIDKVNPVDKESFEDLTLAIIEDPGIRPRELHEKWVVTTQQMIADNALDEKNVARLKPYMVSFNELSLDKQTEYRLQVQLIRNLVRYNRNGERAHKRQRERQRERQRISGRDMGIRKRGISGRPT